MGSFRKKPVVVEAWRLPQIGGQIDTPRWLVDALRANSVRPAPQDGLYIDTLEGTMEAHVGDWIIRGVKGELYPCKDDIFRATYDEEPEAA